MNGYRRAFDAAFEIVDLTRRFPSGERYALTDQIRRSSRAICATIAEAWRQRRYPASFVSTLSDADAEAAETQAWLAVPLRCGYLDADRHAALADRYRHIGAQLVRMMNQADRWCNTDDRRTARG